MEMTIGKLAKAAGVKTDTIRFYERKGILKKPPKHPGGFRYYDANQATRVRFVKRAQELGFTLREVKELLDLQMKRKVNGNEVREKALEKVKEIQEKIANLRQMEGSLKKLAAVCGEGEQAIRECKFTDCFEKSC